MKKFLSLLMAMAMVACLFAACGETEVTPETTGDEVTETVTFTVGTNAEFAPFEYVENNEIVGYDIDMAAEIANDMGAELVIENMDFDGLVTAVSTGKIDAAIAGMSVTEERKESVDFSNPYYTAAQVIIVKADSETVATAADLEGKVVAVQEGTTGDIYVTENCNAKEVARYKKAVNALMDLESGKVDAVVLDEEPAKNYSAQFAGLVILDEALTAEEYAIAVAKGNADLLDAINATIERMTQEGKFDELKEKYGLNAPAEEEAAEETEEVVEEVAAEEVVEEAAETEAE